MSDKRYLGNIITPNQTEPAGPYENDAASGVWSLAEAFAYTIDLGQVWKEWMGLPFVFAVWAAPAGRSGNVELGRLLTETRDHGLRCATDIAAQHAPPRGWPIELAKHYLTECMTYKITPAARQGMARFVELATAEGLIPRSEGAVR